MGKNEFDFVGGVSKIRQIDVFFSGCFGMELLGKDRLVCVYIYIHLYLYIYIIYIPNRD